MAMVNTITVNDGATPAVPRTFNVYDRDGTKSLFRTDTAALVKGQLELFHRATIAASKNAANRSQLTFSMPIEVTDPDGKTRVDSVSTCVIDFNFAQGLSLEQRKIFYGLVVNMLNHADVKAQSISVSPLS